MCLNILYLDLDPEICPNLDPNPSFFYTVTLAQHYHLRKNIIIFEKREKYSFYCNFFYPIFLYLYRLFPLFNCMDPNPHVAELGSNLDLDPDPQHWRVPVPVVAVSCTL